MQSERAQAIEDFDTVVNAADMPVDIMSQKHPNQTAQLSNPQTRFGRQSDSAGSMDYVDRTIETISKELETMPHDHPRRLGMLDRLGRQLRLRFEQTGLMSDLDWAIDVASSAVEATPKVRLFLSDRLNALGFRLSMRYERSGLIGDLDRAIEIISMQLEVTPPDHPDRYIALNDLGSWLGRRFDQSGSIIDIDRAIELLSMAIKVTTSDYSFQAATLLNLGTSLSKRFKRTGLRDDLDHAIEFTRMALKTIPEDHPDHAHFLNNLGVWLLQRFQLSKSLDDLTGAIELLEKVVAVTPETYFERPRRLHNLGRCLAERSRHTGSIQDLNRAIKFLNAAMDLTPKDHPDRSGLISLLGTLHGERFLQTSTMADLDLAIELVQTSVTITSKNHPSRANKLGSLGRWLGARFLETNSEDDALRAIWSFKDSWACHSAPSSTRIISARNAAMFILSGSRQFPHSESNWTDANILMSEAAALLPSVSPRSLKHVDKQRILGEYASIASMATAIALTSGTPPDYALAILESGRNVITSMLLETRGDVSDLKEQYPDLAAEFISLRDELDYPEGQTLPPQHNDLSSWESRAKRLREAEEEFQNLLYKIRTKTPFHNFLSSPTREELANAGNPDPVVVINLDTLRCDAFLITHCGVTVLYLPNLTMKKAREWAQDLRRRPISVLEQLWDNVCGPILQELGFTDPMPDSNRRRIWWIPTGILSQLPLHAAGLYSHGSTDTVLDRVMSSYASSVKALVYGRRDFRRSAGPQFNRALLVSMGETPGLPGTLPNAMQEVEMLNDLFPSLQLQPVTPKPRKDDVLEHLQECRIFHFAGHGLSDLVEPSQSRLLLEDWKTDPLTVGDFRNCKLQENPPYLGYLSACSTGANEVDELANEGIHLINSLQLAGFRHVVGTLYEVSDRHCVDVARIFYETLRNEGMTDAAVCRALHQAVLMLRDVWEVEDGGMRNGRNIELVGEEAQGTPYWVPYVHFGV